MAKKSPKPRDHSDHRVRFDSADEGEKENEIIVKKTDDNKVEVNFGFLQLNHKYMVTFSIPREVLKIDKACKIIPIVDSNSQNINCVSSNVLSHTDKDVKFQVEYHTHKDKIIDEILKYKLDCSERIISVLVISQVLGKGKGTALLKKGVHCMGVLSHEELHEDDSTCDCD
ncbi:adipose-secreted signaling protein isoform X2 [Lycorma delicatula]|uniref:adipose-secreted signaling protein isoform X2 n=1 Tax=Lycorma delicatula TaxID=130591 RepID=UPI003F512F59